MSQYKPYPAYKDSGVEWIGRVPEHWGIAQLSKISTDRCDGPFGSGLKSEHYAESGVRVVRLQNIGYAEFKDGDSVYISSDYWSDELGCGHAVLPGDLLMAGLGDANNPLGRSCVAPESIGHAIVKADCYRFRLNARAVSEFVALALSATSRGECGFLAAGATRDRLNLTLASARQVPLPPLAEQSIVAAALGREAARIDALIAKKTRFIDLLKEKREALITHAVTKGLNPNVTMKDSGAAWIGEVPEHWEVLPSTWLFVESNERARVDDEHLSATQKYGVIPLAEYERLEARQVTHAVKNLEQRKHVEIGNFVISMRSFEGGIERVRARGCVRSSYVVLLPETTADIGFYAYLFKSSTYIQGLQATSSFIRDGQDLSYANFRQVKLPAPGFDEQRTIAAHLDQRTTRIDALVSTTERSVSLLKERRSALVTAAVTGQIDLRESAK